MKQRNVFIDQQENNFYWLMWEGLCAHFFWENGTLAMRHNHNGSVYRMGSDFDLDVAVGAMVADY